MMCGYKFYTDEMHATGYADSANVTDPEAIEAFQALHDLIYKTRSRRIAPRRAALDQLGGAFQSGRVAMEINGGWGWWSYKPLIDDPERLLLGRRAAAEGRAGRRPARGDLHRPVGDHGQHVGRRPGSAAWTFVKFLVSPEQAREYALVGGAPPTQGALLDEYFKQFEKCHGPGRGAGGLGRRHHERPRIVQPPAGAVGRAEPDLG